MIAHLGLNHKTAPVHVRERFAFNPEACCATLSRLKANNMAEEGVILSTCNRVELYLAGANVDKSGMLPLLKFLAQERGIEYTDDLSKSFYFDTQEETVRHLFEVVSGMDSMALGETEISGQVKNAYDLALKNHFTGHWMNKIFQDAFRTAKHIRSHTDIQHGHISVANVAVTLAEKIFLQLSGNHILVIGAGDTSAKLAKAILSREPEARLSIVNRTLERSQKLAESLGGQAVPIQNWQETLPDIDIILSGTSAPNYVLTYAEMEKYMAGRPNQPILLIDVAVPRDIDPAIGSLEDVHLYNIDDLQIIADNSRKLREQQLQNCKNLVEERVQAFFQAVQKSENYLQKHA